MQSKTKETDLDDKSAAGAKLVKREFTHLGTVHEVFIPDGLRLITKAELSSTISALEEAKHLLARAQQDKRAAIREATEALASTIIRQEKALKRKSAEYLSLRRENAQLKRCISSPIRWLFLSLLNRAINAEERNRAEETKSVLRTAEELLKTEHKLSA